MYNNKKTQHDCALSLTAATLCNAVQSIALHLLDTACVDAEAHIAMSSKRISVKLALHKVLLQLRAAIAQTRCSVHCMDCGQQAA
eukprot:21394-Heterococcus_DN1.PRE.1